jgi:hypothetical protein
MLEAPKMAKRHRTRPRTRRGVEAARRAPAPRVDRDEAPVARSATHRPSRSSRTGYSRAAGAPSATLERAAMIERSFISKDFRRLALVVGISVALLIVAGILENVVIK